MQDGLVSRTDFTQDGLYSLDLFHNHLMRRIHDMQQQVGLHDLLEGGLERFDKVMRQLTDETDCIRHERGLVVGQLDLPGRGIQRGEKLVVHLHLRASEGVQQGGLARIRISHQRDQCPSVAPTPAPLFGSMLDDVFQRLADAMHPVLDAAAVQFQLLLARTAQADTALLSLKVRPHSAQPRQQVMKLGKFDLEATFLRARMLGEDVENELCAINDLRAEHRAQITALRGRQLIVKDHRADIIFFHAASQFFRFAFADEGTGIQGCLLADDAVCHIRAGRLRKQREFVERIVDKPFLLPAKLHAYQQHPFLIRIRS